LAQKKDIDLAAQVLNISRSGLYKKIKDYNIDTKDI
jgi:transcriptional regulator of acetoin/glycerol metabolism